MRIENINGLSILYPDEGLLLFKKSDEERTYHEKVYMAKYESSDDYGEVTYAYAYGESNDEEFVKLQKSHDELAEMVELQSDVIDIIMFSNEVGFYSETKSTFSLDPLNSLAKYFAVRITSMNLPYDLVISKFPELKDRIDTFLEKENISDNE